jgi:hypothetical protein
VIAPWKRKECEMNLRVSVAILLPLALVGLTLVGCVGVAPTPDGGDLSGGLLATFDVVGEEFSVWVTNPQTIEQILDLQSGASQANIPNGVILRGSGKADHNAPWGWHLDPEQIEMAEVTVEVCDGTPSFVEEELDYFVEDVGRYCPWSAQLVAVEDYR